MVSLSDIQSSNSRIATTLPPSLVALFVGATSGIGEITLKTFAKYVHQPHAYFIGRSQHAADRIVAECKEINPAGEYTFIKADVSLIRVVDKLCEEIKAKEKTLNILFMSAGVPSLDRSETSEHVHLLAALTYYSRLRFITNLLPLLQSASSLRRVVTVAGGGKEGFLDSNDFPALHVPLPELHGHLCTLISLGLEAVAKMAPGISFVHGYPGTVKTGLYRRMQDVSVIPMTTEVPIEESGERHLYLATSARFTSKAGSESAVPLTDGVGIAQGTTGKAGSGVYSVDWDCENASHGVMELLADLREKGMVDEVWRHTEGEFRRIVELND